MLYLVAAAFALERSTQVIHHHISTPRGEEEGIGSSESTASAGDHDRLAIVAKLLCSHILIHVQTVKSQLGRMSKMAKVGDVVLLEYRIVILAHDR